MVGLPLLCSVPAMNSRKGYEATATRSRGSVGNLTAGCELVAESDSAGRKQAPAAAIEVCARNSLRVVFPMTRQFSREPQGSWQDSCKDSRLGCPAKRSEA